MAKDNDAETPQDAEGPEQPQEAQPPEMTKAVVITQVRHDEEKGRDELQRFIFGRPQWALRVPRGVEPELVSDFIKDRLTPEAPAQAYGNALRVLRFYERGDVVEPLLRALKRQEAEADDLRRSMAIAQIAGDIGTADEAKQAAEYFDTVLVPHPRTRDALREMLLTPLTLAPEGALEKAEQRLKKEVDQAARSQRESEAKMAAYDRLHAIQRNDLPRLKRALDKKNELAPKPPAERRDELVSMYVSQTVVGGDYIRTWVGRLIRRDAMSGNAEAVRAALLKHVAAVDSRKLGDPNVAYPFVRAAQAVVYLQGRLPMQYHELYGRVQDKGEHFLWDDLAL